MAISPARNALAGIDAKLDPSMVVNRGVSRSLRPRSSTADEIWSARAKGSKHRSGLHLDRPLDRCDISVSTYRCSIG
jgi:hypothetical protein